MVKERPIIFNTEMVKAILDSRKTQTRRVVKPQPKYGIIDGGSEICIKNPSSAHPDVNEGKWINCPYGKIGDKLWIRETWADIPGGGALVGGGYIETVEGQTVYKADGYNYSESLKWKPSIFMPRWASRINLEITDIRVERVQDIRIDDAIAEGVCLNPPDCHGMRTEAIKWFQELWDSINAKRKGCSWIDNPWCWAIGFKRGDNA